MKYDGCFGDGPTRYLRAYPDAEDGVVVRKNADGTLDVALSHGDSSGNYPETELRHIPCINKSIYRSVQSGSNVKIGYIKGNRQAPFVLGLSGSVIGRTTVIDNRPVDPGVYNPPKALPLNGVQWYTWGGSIDRGKFSGYSDKEWTVPFPAPFFPLAKCSVVGPPRTALNRIFIICSGDDEDSRITDKLQLGRISPQRDGLGDPPSAQQSPYILRICHLNITQGSHDGVDGEAGDGNPANLEDNLHINDIEFTDLPLTWDSNFTLNNYVLPMEVYITPYVRPLLFEFPFENEEPVEEFVWITVLWCAPVIQDTLVGRAWAATRDDTPWFLQEGTNRFFISEHLINACRTYQILESEEFVNMDFHPYYRQPSNHLGLREIYSMYGTLPSGTTGWSSPSDFAADHQILYDRPCGRTQWVEELPGAPVAMCHFVEPIPAPGTSKDSMIDKKYVIITAYGSLEMEDTETDSRIFELKAHLFNCSTKNIQTTTTLSMNTPSPLWDVYPDSSDVHFFNDRPTEDVGVVPWFTTTLRYAEDHKNTYGLVKDAGMLDKVLFHRKGEGDSQEIFIIPSFSYTPQIRCWKMTYGGTASEEWAIEGWTDHPTTYRVYNICGLYNVSTNDTPEWKLLVHFEERSSTNSVFGILARYQDFIDLISYEDGTADIIPGIPGDNFFTPYDWPRPGQDWAWGIDAEVPGEYGGQTTFSELTEIFEYVTDFIPSMEGSETGFDFIESDRAASTQVQGMLLIDPETGTIITEEYIDMSTGSFTIQIGPIECEWYTSVYVPKYTSPAEVSDTYGPVFPEGTGGTVDLDEAGFIEPLDTGQVSLLTKIWSVRYNNEEPYTSVDGNNYEHPEWIWTRSSIGFINSSAHLGTYGFFRDCNGAPIFEGEEEIQAHGNWDLIDYGRYFYALRVTSYTASYEIVNSSQTPFNPNDAAFRNDPSGANNIAIMMLKRSGYLVSEE